ncbi:MAG: hypothetical protein A2504_09665 [Bdellovibrionales bacterium RIFOXYD12_FULL_39_22]|nr:MAG: hypothetical protein A2385_13155 [Bdellovibrionales bacterium RIFOXYB1_FULL_39_21]OFZ40994.1 MAG: hypothetical protein A2485_16665 [Bdellovibrionales bacterium RIFOXYC12_FULL_39_17]OFZ44822.1 MAG: hypothetical protein A2404_09955 [Bdellovibrionales bacterium RIFOXYC1_FULL_39_130]OFZ74287.1 MAG: hypothetical protein A2560_16920 [Bdellovibrionales bacterium RIFOXYD1_FULL_39_84]OFZ92151.1 MAG: hypothetical protein A2504_09665 [Bdellovibrionales bacterium RIFOXYD12_FULL_39_22]HLE12745.1 hy
MNEATKKCPFCAEEIKAQAVVCKHCKSNLEEIEEETDTTQTVPSFFVRVKRLIFGQTSVTDFKDRTISRYILDKRKEKTANISYQNKKEGQGPEN